MEATLRAYEWQKRHYLHLGGDVAQGVGDGAVGGVHERFLFEEELLLGSKDRARPTDTDPSDHGGGRDFVVLHRVKGYQRSRSAQPGLAVDGDGAWLLFGFGEEFLDLVLWAVWIEGTSEGQVPSVK